MKILIIHWRFLEPDTNSGDLRLYEIIKILRNIGHQVYFIQPGKNDNKYLKDKEVYLPMTFETANNKSHKFRLFLLYNNFNLAILAPFYTFSLFATRIKRTIPNCKLILDTIDLFHIRTRRQAEITKEKKDYINAEETYIQEWKCLKTADSVWVVTETEKKIIEPFVKDVQVISNIHNVSAQIKPFREREGIIFLGGHSHVPNRDAVIYFIKTILPKIRKSLPVVSIIIAGSNPPESYYELARENNIIITGYLRDHRTILQSSRVGIAPLRYGAGMKGKIGEYLSCGLPCVTTMIGAEGMNMESGRNVIISDDPIDFALNVINLYEDEKLWNHISLNGLKYIEQNLSPKIIEKSLNKALLNDINKNLSQRLSLCFSIIRSLFIIVGSKIKQILKLHLKI